MFRISSGNGSGDDDSADWATNYAGHFAIEAQKAGYLPPPGVLDQWTAFQRRRARAGVPGEGQAELTQAYRLFTLALVGAAELPAMNQLRERPSLPVAAKWRLAAAYQLAGQPEAARGLATGGPPSIEPYRELGFTYGSDLRDRAMVLEAVVLLGLAEHVGPLAKSVSESLSKKEWLSTHETAYALLALSKAVTAAMQELAMAGGRFSASLRQLPEPAAGGAEEIEFEVASHPSLPLRPLAKVASGGELSRISLAIQLVAAKASPVATLVFDEVDSGIGGAVAQTIGKSLRKLGGDRQVLCVTHLPQVAASGDAQWSVTKAASRGRLRVQVARLDHDARIEELARMLGGAEGTARKHAAELLEGG